MIDQTLIRLRFKLMFFNLAAVISLGGIGRRKEKGKKKKEKGSGLVSQ